MPVEALTIPIFGKRQAPYYEMRLFPIQILVSIIRPHPRFASEIVGPLDARQGVV